MRWLIAIPVYNEQGYVRRVLEKVLAQARAIEAGHDGLRVDVLAIDDGSTDHTPCLLAQQRVDVIRHATNHGYGRSLRDAFRWAIANGYDWVLTMDCDEQHEPAAIPQFVSRAALGDADVISGSRYLRPDARDDSAPAERASINALVTREVNERLGLRITDAFCGFKAYRVRSLRRLDLTVDGYAFPMQFWAQAVAQRLRIVELPVRRIYKDMTRSFGNGLDDGQVRLALYRRVLLEEIERFADRLPAAALSGLPATGAREPDAGRGRGSSDDGSCASAYCRL
jgi:dolichol-phosphate mannosyltransferase